MFSIRRKLGLTLGASTVTAALAGALLISLPAPGAAAASLNSAQTTGLTVTVVNNSAYGNDKVWVSGTGNGTGASSLPLSQRSSFTTDGLSSGRVWVSLGEQLSGPTFPSPDNSTTRFDVVELTYPGVANLTAVDMFGIPMDIETFDKNGNPVSSKKWACYTDKIQETMKARLDAAGGDYDKIVRKNANGDFLRLVSPNIVSGQHSSGYPRFDNYISSLIGQQLTVRGHAMGQDYVYTGAFEPDLTDPSGPGSITLTDQSSSHLPTMYVKGSTLVGNEGNNSTSGIYGNNSPYYVGGVPHTGNDVYGAAYRDLVAGFAYGFWGSADYGNDSGQFNVSSAPGPFEHAQPNATNYNVWAAGLWDMTAAYGFPYGDTYNNDETRNPIVQLPTDGTLKITIQPDVSPAGCSASTPPPTTPPVTPPPTTPPVTPPPVPPVARGKQSQAPMSKKLEKPGRTIVNRMRARTEQGKRLTATVVAVSAKGWRGKTPTFGYEIIERPHNKLVVKLTNGLKKVKVRVSYTAPGNRLYLPYSNTILFKSN